jgi:catechol 2,3-dioxygenase
VIDPAAHIGAVHLMISDVNRSVRFYQTHLGFKLHGTKNGSAVLGADRDDLLILHENKTAPRAHGTTGLYHFAVRVPSRADLARALRRIVDTNTPLQGASDHGVSEALYLEDPDGNGIEIYRDRPRDAWPFVDGNLEMSSDPIDLLALVSEEENDEIGLAAGTTIGHVHLHVSDLADAERFYVGVLGFTLMQRYGPSAIFVSAGGYHHHIGLNTWAGVGAPPPPQNAIGLHHFVVRLAGLPALKETVARVREAGIEIEQGDGTALVRDPSRNAIALSV